MLELWNGVPRKKGGLAPGMVRSFLQSDGTKIVDLVGNNFNQVNGTVDGLKNDSNIVLHNPASILFPTTPTGNSLQLTRTDLDPQFQMSSGDFCIEAWMRLRVMPTGSNQFALFSTYGSTRTNEVGFYRTNDFSVLVNTYGRIYGYTMGTSIGIIDSELYAVSAGSWFHWAFCKRGTERRFFVNGVRIYSSPNDNNTYRASMPAFGGVWNSDGQAGEWMAKQLDGNLDQARYVIGDSVYWGNFTPEKLVY